MEKRVGPIERELTRRCFEARREMAAATGSDRDYWRGQAEALADAARYCEGLES